MKATIASRNQALDLSVQKTAKPVLSHTDIQNVISWLQWRVVTIEDVSPEKEAVLTALNSWVIWQQSACEQIADMIDIGLNRVVHKKGPLGVVLLSWPTWVWKTEVMRMLAKHFLWDEDAFIFIPWEKFQDSYDVAKLHGSTDGLVGFGKKKYFHKVWDDYANSKKIHEHIQGKKWFSLLLVDEVEKMHPAVHQSLLSVLEEWVVEVTTNKSTDANSNNYEDETIDLSDTFIVFTSNIWEADIAQIKSKNEIWFWIRDKSKDSWEEDDIFTKKLKNTFSPEFLGRIGAPIRFNNISKQDAKKIIVKRIEDMNETLTGYFKKWNIHVWATPEAIEFLLGKWFSDEKWARALWAAIKKYIERPVNRILKENANETFMERKNPTIINFDVSKWWDALEPTFFLPEITLESWILDSDEVYDVTTETVDRIKTTLAKAEQVSSIYDEFIEDGFKDEEVDILMHLDSEQILGMVLDIENFPSRENIFSDADVFGANFPPRSVRNLIERKTRELGRIKVYQKDTFILTAIVKSISIFEGIFEVSQLSELQEKIIIRFAIISALKNF